MKSACMELILSSQLSSWTKRDYFLSLGYNGNILLSFTFAFIDQQKNWLKMKLPDTAQYGLVYRRKQKQTARGKSHCKGGCILIKILSVSENIEFYFGHNNL